jgi:hypothetical protein
MIATPANLLPEKADQKNSLLHRGSQPSVSQFQGHQRILYIQLLNGYFVGEYANYCSPCEPKFPLSVSAKSKGAEVNYSPRGSPIACVSCQQPSYLREAAGTERPLLAGPIRDDTLESMAARGRII